jgi:hypothetical protein
MKKYLKRLPNNAEIRYGKKRKGTSRKKATNGRAQKTATASSSGIVY